MNNIIDKYNGFIFDLDGTIYRGNQLIFGADILINKLKSDNKNIIFISNKTTGTIKEYCKLLNNLGIPAKQEEILNSTIVIKEFLHKNHVGKHFFSISEQVFIDEIRESGLIYTENPEEVDILLITLDRFVNEEKIKKAEKTLKNGALFYAANIDKTCPVENNKEITDAGIIIDRLEKETGVKLIDHFGKPSGHMMDEILKRIKTPIDKCLIIGDRIETDIFMGNKFNIDTIWVKSGVKSDLETINKIVPSYAMNSVAELLK